MAFRRHALELTELEPQDAPQFLYVPFPLLLHLTSPEFLY
jgi:hypothetical protein